MKKKNVTNLVVLWSLAITLILMAILTVYCRCVGVDEAKVVIAGFVGFSGIIAILQKLFGGGKDR